MSCGNAADAEDLTLRTLERGLAKLGSFHGDSSLFTWLYKIQSRLFLNDLKSKGRSRLEYLSDLPEERMVEDPLPSPVVQAEHENQAEELHAAVARLPSPFRETLVLRFYEERSIAETAAILDCKEGTVKSRLNSALRMLRTFYRSRLSKEMK